MACARPKRAMQGGAVVRARRRSFAIMLIGPSMSGKTSLLRRYLDDTFDAAYVGTNGVGGRAKADAATSSVLRLLDASGAERHHAVRTSMLPSADAVVVCFAAPNFAGADNSIGEIDASLAEARYPDSVAKTRPVALAACKCDAAKDADRIAARQYAAKLGLCLFETSAKVGKTEISLLFSSIITMLRRNTGASGHGLDQRAARIRAAAASAPSTGCDKPFVSPSRELQVVNLELEATKLLTPPYGEEKKRMRMGLNGLNEVDSYLNSSTPEPSKVKSLSDRFADRIDRIRALRRRQSRVPAIQPQPETTSIQAHVSLMTDDIDALVAQSKAQLRALESAIDGVSVVANDVKKDAQTPVSLSKPTLKKTRSVSQRPSRRSRATVPRRQTTTVRRRPRGRWSEPPQHLGSRVAKAERRAWVVGDKVEIYSLVFCAWHGANIAETYNNRGVAWLGVHSPDGLRLDIPRDAPGVRPAVSNDSKRTERRAAWVVGDMVEVCSASRRGWAVASITSVDGEWLRVSYTDGGGTKEVRRTDQELVRPLPPGAWTGERVARRGRSRVVSGPPTPHERPRGRERVVEPTRPCTPSWNVGQLTKGSHLLLGETQKPEPSTGQSNAHETTQDKDDKKTNIPRIFDQKIDLQPVSSQSSEGLEPSPSPTPQPQDRVTDILNRVRSIGEKLLKLSTTEITKSSHGDETDKTVVCEPSPTPDPNLDSPTVQELRWRRDQVTMLQAKLRERDRRSQALRTRLTEMQMRVQRLGSSLAHAKQKQFEVKTQRNDVGTQHPPIQTHVSRDRRRGEAKTTSNAVEKNGRSTAETPTPPRVRAVSAISTVEKPNRKHRGKRHWNGKLTWHHSSRHHSSQQRPITKPGLTRRRVRAASASAIVASHLRLGTRVRWTKSAARQGPANKGVLRYLGKVHFASGLWAGVRLDKRGPGRHGGVVQGRRYFRCALGHGVLVQAGTVVAL